MNRNKVRGMVVGGAVGDALGMPVETWTPEKIREVHPQGLPHYVPPINHKWFDPEKTPAGTTTDDTQLTIATMLGLILGHPNVSPEQPNFQPYMKGIADEHCLAMRASTDGWGGTTKESIRRLQNGVHWSNSGRTTESNRGLGNGVPMKIAPLAAWLAAPGSEPVHGQEHFHFNWWCVTYSAMTHYTRVSAHAGLCHVWAVYMCLHHSPSDFHTKDFCDLIGEMVWEWENEATNVQYDTKYLVDDGSNLRRRMVRLAELRDALPTMTRDEIVKEFGSGGCYVLESVPFSYAYFLKNHLSFDTIREVAEAGGDTDTNAKMVGEMLGALHGYESLKTYWPWAIEGLRDHDKLLATADTFCNVFGIE